jgi:hypothetical protein
MPDTPRCGLPHYTWPETVCTEPDGHYRPNIDPHAGPLIIDGHQRGGCAWDQPMQPPEPLMPDDTRALTRVQIDLNVRSRGNKARVGYEDATGPLQPGQAVEVYESETNLTGTGTVSETDDDLRLAWIDLDWSKLRPASLQPATPARDEYEQATGHDIACTVGINDQCGCGTADGGNLRERLHAALRAHGESDTDHGTGSDYGDQASAVLTVVQPLVDRAEAAIRRTRALHQRSDQRRPLDLSLAPIPHCAHCGQDWPCDTTRALDGGGKS